MREYCSGENRCLDCPIAEDDTASITALNSLMRAVRPFSLNEEKLSRWVGIVTESREGADPEAVQKAAQMHADDDCAYQITRREE